MRSQQAERSLQEYKVEMERSTSQLFQQMKDEVMQIIGGCGYLGCYGSCKTWRWNSARLKDNLTKTLRSVKDNLRRRGD